jgi:DNA-binding MarR family transcriptional regulator
MTAETYTDTHPLRGAFVANLLGRLVDRIVAQGEDLLQDAGLDFPSRAASSVLLIGERGNISAADIASALGQPHQLVTQRIELLIDLKVVKRISDPKDGRRKILALTNKGTQQFLRLQTRLANAERAFQGLFEEIDCDLPAVAARAMEALGERSILDRVTAIEAAGARPPVSPKKDS